MSKAVMISIKPKWVELIASGQKTVEVRKTRPKIDVPFKCYIYCTLNGSNEFFHETLNGDVARWNRGKWWDKKGKVVGEFVCDEIQFLDIDSVGVFVRGDNGDAWYMDEMGWKLGLSRKEVISYCGYKRPYGWHISNLKMYDKPKELSKFCNGNSYLTIGENGKFTYTGMTRPPQSWGYVEELE